jgi:pimeloyl-ACP methyl ester carboxylesterase
MRVRASTSEASFRVVREPPRKRRTFPLVLSTLAAVLLAPAVASAADEFGVSCQEVTFNVSLDGSSPGTLPMNGTLCVPPGNQHHIVQLLVHGATYNRSYWDFPFQPDHYAYVRYAHAAGYATLAIDRIGAGTSAHPPGEDVTVHASANTLHQAIGMLRSGAVSGADGRPIRFERIVVVGHSFGSNVAWTEAGTYGDVDGVVLTGISHLLNPPGQAVAEANIYPAQDDPLFANANLPENYFTTLPGTRSQLFYYAAGADPRVIAEDEATKDVVPLGLFLDQFTTYGLTQNIHVPVFTVDGNFDTLSCALPSCTGSGTLDTEASNYPSDACYEQFIVPDAGHDINLHRNAPLWFALAQAWIADHIGIEGFDFLPPPRKVCR